MGWLISFILDNIKLDFVIKKLLFNIEICDNAIIINLIGYLPLRQKLFCYYLLPTESIT